MPKTDTNEVETETAIRAYLSYLQDPDSLVDNDKIATLEKEVAATKDPIERLIAMAALHRAREADPAAIISDFTKNARVWAEAEGVPESAFREMGVPGEVLQDAGFGKVRKSRATRNKSDTPRRRAMSTDQLKEAILALDEPFSIRDVTERIGGSPVTVKNAIAALEGDGKIRRAGDKHLGRGRAAKMWMVGSA
jgi:hypothetical protein